MSGEKIIDICINKNKQDRLIKEFLKCKNLSSMKEVLVGPSEENFRCSQRMKSLAFKMDFYEDSVFTDYATRLADKIIGNNKKLTIEPEYYSRR